MVDGPRGAGDAPCRVTRAQTPRNPTLLESVDPNEAFDAATHEAVAGRDQFLEKREPDWSDFPWYC